MEKMISKAKRLGFSDAKIMKVSDLVIRPEYRKYCEMNVCGHYNEYPTCPTRCGSVEDMVQKLNRYTFALVLQTEQPKEKMGVEDMQRAQAIHNVFTEVLMKALQEEKPEMLFISAGPWKQYSSLSAYCIDSQQMAESVGMKCWDDADVLRCFSLLLFS